jgi:hypothetical protein
MLYVNFFSCLYCFQLKECYFLLGFYLLPSLTVLSKKVYSQAPLLFSNCNNCELMEMCIFIPRCPVFTTVCVWASRELVSPRDDHTHTQTHLFSTRPSKINQSGQCGARCSSNSVVWVCVREWMATREAWTIVWQWPPSGHTLVRPARKTDDQHSTRISLYARSERAFKAWLQLLLLLRLYPR